LIFVLTHYLLQNFGDTTLFICFTVVGAVGTLMLLLLKQPPQVIDPEIAVKCMSLGVALYWNFTSLL
jgi:hypothetical protein